MIKFTRRSLFKISAATISLTAIPFLPAIALPSVFEPKPLFRGKAWSVGTPGEYDWHVIRANTKLEAVRIWSQEECYEEKDLEEIGIVANREERWDNLDIEAGDKTWFMSEYGSYCDRCDDETTIEEGGHVVNDEIVCMDCMQISDWEIIDPEIAEEMKLDLEA